MHFASQIQRVALLASISAFIGVAATKYDTAEFTCDKVHVDAFTQLPPQWTESTRPFTDMRKCPRTPEQQNNPALKDIIIVSSRTAEMQPSTDTIMIIVPCLGANDELGYVCCKHYSRFAYWGDLKTHQC